MNKRIVIFCTILAVFLLGIAAFIIVKLFEPQVEGAVIDSRTDIVNCIPSDAIAIVDVDKLSQFNSLFIDQKSSFSKIIDSKSGIIRFISTLGESLSSSSSSVSLHYSSKNKVSLLFATVLPKGLDSKELAAKLESEVSGVTKKRYGETLINKCVVPNISYAFYGNFLIASPSLVLLESSIRHLENHTSFYDNEGVDQISSYFKDGVSLIINHKNLGKFYSGTVVYDRLKGAEIASSFTSLTGVKVSVNNNVALFEGEGLSALQSDEFVTVFMDQRSKESELFSILPPNTIEALSVRLSSPKKLLEAYENYLKAHKKFNDYNYVNVMKAKEQDLHPKEWFLSLDPEEMVLASLPTEKMSESIIMLRLKNTKDLHSEQDVTKFKYQGFMKTLLGDIFEKVDDKYCAVIEDWYIIGSRSVVESMVRIKYIESYFSLNDYIEQTEAKDILKKSSNVSYFLSPIAYAESFGKLFKPNYASVLSEGLKNFNFSLLYSDLNVDKTKSLISGLATLDNLDELPSPKGSIFDAMSTKEDTSQVRVPKGPFNVKNFLNKKTNYLQQLDDNRLRLLDDRKRSVWTTDFSSPICGYVGQIDLYKNNKLQMLVGSGSKLYLLDRLGRWVTDRFPVDLKKNILLGPAVYDFNNSKDYAFMILHTDNTLALYNQSGTVYGGWTPITTKEKILTLPELLKVENENYWIVRTAFQTIIYNANGLSVADFGRRKQLAPDTKIEVLSASEVEVSTIDQKQMILNLKTGSLKRK